MAMTKGQFISHLAEKSGLSKKEVITFWEILIATIYKEAKAGEAILPGLGKLIKKNRKARMGRNPATGEAIKIAAKTVLKFRLAKAAKDEVLG